MVEHPPIRPWHLVLHLPTIPGWLWITALVIFGLAFWAVAGTATVAALNKKFFEGDSGFEMLAGIFWPVALVVTAIVLLTRPLVQFCQELYQWILDL